MSYAYPGRDTYYGYDVLQFDRYTGALLHHRLNAEKNTGERLVEMNYDIHVGAIGGLTGKIIALYRQSYLRQPSRHRLHYLVG